MNTSTKGWINGLLGVIIFSGSLPATRVAVGGFSPLFLTSARAVIAALIGAALLFTLKQRRPARGDISRLIIVAIGVVVGFPLLTALALQHITSAHSIIFIGLLPFSTAVFGVLRGNERPKPLFWVFSGLGGAAVAAFAIQQNMHDTADISLTGDLLMIAAIVLCGLGYAEGATLSRRLGGWQVISWALVISLPIMVVLAAATLPQTWAHVTAPQWVGLGYVSVFSMLIGFVFWYRGLAIGGITGVGQLQLLQPFFGLFLAYVVLHEPVVISMIGVAFIVLLCVIASKRYAT